MSSFLEDFTPRVNQILQDSRSGNFRPITNNFQCLVHRFRQQQVVIIVESIKAAFAEGKLDVIKEMYLWFKEQASYEQFEKVAPSLSFQIFQNIVVAIFQLDHQVLIEWVFANLPSYEGLEHALAALCFCGKKQLFQVFSPQQNTDSFFWRHIFFGACQGTRLDLVQHVMSQLKSSSNFWDFVNNLQWAFQLAIYRNRFDILHWLYQETHPLLTRYLVKNEFSQHELSILLDYGNDAKSVSMLDHSGVQSLLAQKKNKTNVVHDCLNSIFCRDILTLLNQFICFESSLEQYYCPEHLLLFLF
jgi:hypothetical protein